MKHLLVAVAMVLSTNVIAQSIRDHDAASVKSWDDAYVKFDTAQNMTNRVTITWLPVDDPNRLCGEMYRLQSGKEWLIKVNACSSWEQLRNGAYMCTIVTLKKTTMHTLGHEVRHCFQNAWHTW